MTTAEKPKAECAACKSVVRLLLPGYILRRHVDQSVPADRPRRERLCPNSRTRSWRALDSETGVAAFAAWMAIDRAEEYTGLPPEEEP